MEHSKNKRRYSFSATCAIVARMGRKGVRQDPVANSTSDWDVMHGRRTSLTEKASFSVPPSDFNQCQNKHDHMLSVSSLGLASDRTVQRGGGGKSWKDILRLWKREKIASPSVKKSEMDSNVYKSKPAGVCIRVVVTEINPQAYYKTLEIKRHTTVFEVIVRLIQKYALKDEARDPNEYYLTEVREGYQGSYSRVLSNSDLVNEIRSKWDAEEECYFALYGTCLSETRTNGDPPTKDKFEQSDVHMTPMIISPSQDSFYNSFPDIGSIALPMALPPLNFDTPPTATNRSPSSLNGISSHILSSKLTISPSEKSGDFETSVFQLPTSVALHSKPIEHSMKYVEMKADTEHAREVEYHAENNERGLSDLEWRKGTKASQRQQMHESISMGMDEIMAKVVLETKWNSPSRKVNSRRSSSPSKLLTTESTLQPSAQDMTIYNRLCSPAPKQLNGRHYADFKFPPSPDYPTSDREEGLPGDEPHRKSGMMENTIDIGEQDKPAISVVDYNWVSDSAEKQKRKAERAEEEKEMEGDEEEIEEKGHRCQYMTKSFPSHAEASSVQDFTIHRELNYNHVPAEGRSHLEKYLVVGIKHRTSSTFTPTGFLKQRTRIKQEMEPTQSPSNLIDQKKISPSSKTRNLSSTLRSHSLSTLERSMQAALTLRRSHTDQATTVTSVTSLKRPHSFHIGKLDVMNDEAFCKATLRGMMKKPSSKEHLYTSVISTTSNISRDNLIQFPVRETVTDLDLAALSKEKKRYLHPLQRDISTPRASEKQYVKLRDRKAILDGDCTRISRSTSMDSSVPNRSNIQGRQQ